MDALKDWRLADNGNIYVGPRGSGSCILTVHGQIYDGERSRIGSLAVSAPQMHELLKWLMDRVEVTSSSIRVSDRIQDPESSDFIEWKSKVEKVLAHSS